VKRLLLVSYYFPPLAGAGVFRPLRMSKYLPRHGWNVTVLTAGARARALRDASLASEVHPDTVVERTASLEPRSAFLALNRLGLRGLVRRLEPWFMLPDDQRGWVPFATRRGARLFDRAPYDAIVTTAGPYSAHLVGLRLRAATGVPWVADFRDEWTTNPYLRERYPTAWHARRNRGMERRVLRAADRVVCVSAPWLDSLRALGPAGHGEKFSVLENGYDAEHFAGVGGPLPERFRVVYTGTFYGHRSPGPFLDGLRRAVAPGRIPRAEIEVVIMGHGQSRQGPATDLADILQLVEERPYFESLRLLGRAALLLLVVPREGGAGNHTGKLFPYLASGRPILALAPEDNVAARIVRESRSGVVVPPDDPEAVARALVERHELWKRGILLEDQDRQAIARYEADPQAARWAQLLGGLVETASRSSIRRRETARSE